MRNKEKEEKLQEMAQKPNQKVETDEKLEKFMVYSKLDPVFKKASEKDIREYALFTQKIVTHINDNHKDATLFCKASAGMIARKIFLETNESETEIIDKYIKNYEKDFGEYAKSLVLINDVTQHPYTFAKKKQKKKNKK